MAYDPYAWMPILHIQGVGVNIYKTTVICYGEVMVGMRERAILVFEDGRIKWTGRKVVRGMKRRGKEYPVITLPVELRSWMGKTVEIEKRSETEIVVRLVDGDKK